MDSMVMDRKTYEYLTKGAPRHSMPAREFQLRTAIKQREASGEDATEARAALNDYFRRGEGQ